MQAQLQIPIHTILHIPSIKESYRDLSASYLRAPSHLTLHLTPQDGGCCAGKESAYLLAVLFDDHRVAPASCHGTPFLHPGTASPLDRHDTSAP